MYLNYLKLFNSVIKGWVAEYKFHPTRRWRADFANPTLKIIIECEGGVWSSGRHVRGTGYINDIIKYNQATLLGWRIFRFTPQMMEKGEFFAIIQEAVLDVQSQSLCSDCRKVVS